MGWGFDISKVSRQVTEEQVRARLNTFVGAEVEDVEIQKLSYWYVNQTWATEDSKAAYVLWRMVQYTAHSTIEWFRFKYLHAGCL